VPINRRWEDFREMGRTVRGNKARVGLSSHLHTLFEEHTAAVSGSSIEANVLKGWQSKNLEAPSTSVRVDAESI
jgi:hypothetical protein